LRQSITYELDMVPFHSNPKNDPNSVSREKVTISPHSTFEEVRAAIPEIVREQSEYLDDARELIQINPRFFVVFQNAIRANPEKIQQADIKSLRERVDELEQKLGKKDKIVDPLNLMLKELSEVYSAFQDAGAASHQNSLSRGLPVETFYPIKAMQNDLCKLSFQAGQLLAMEEGIVEQHRLLQTAVKDFTDTKKCLELCDSGTAIFHRFKSLAGPNPTTDGAAIPFFSIIEMCHEQNAFIFARIKQLTTKK